ncbi:MAG: hypothetical protein ABEJ83_02240 [Candidatus Nanohaloarchaea archaeon]
MIVIGTATALSTAGLLGVLEIYHLKTLHPYSWSLGKAWIAGIPTLGLGIYISDAVDTRLLLGVTLPVTVVFVYTGLLILLRGFTEADRRVAEKVDDKLGISVFERIVSIGES